MVQNYWSFGIVHFHLSSLDIFPRVDLQVQSLPSLIDTALPLLSESDICRLSCTCSLPYNNNVKMVITLKALSVKVGRLKIKYWP